MNPHFCGDLAYCKAARLTARAESAERDAEGSRVAYEYAVARAETAERERDRRIDEQDVRKDRANG